MERESIVLERFDAKHIRRAAARLPIICIYDSPEDYPGQFVARLWDVDKPTPYITIAPTLEAIRETIPAGMMKIVRSPEDVPCIIETWI